MPQRLLQIKTRVREEGAVLVISMILVLVVTIATLASMGGSQMQERMTSNLTNKTTSFMAAEAGASAFWAWITEEEESGRIDWENPSWQASWQEEQDLPSEVPSSPGIGDHGAYWISADWSDADGVEGTVTVTVTGVSLVAGESQAESVIELTINRPVPGQNPAGENQPNPAFFAGLLSDGDITINGASSFQGSIHANGDFRNASGGSALSDRTLSDEDGNPITSESRITAGGAANFGGSTPTAGRIQSSVEPIVVPSAREHIEQARTQPGVIQSCTIPSGDGQGAIYYCAGDLTLGGGNYQNMIIMASGNISHNGASSLNQTGELDVAVIAGGNITFNGANNTYGVYWSEGNVVQNGSSTLAGSIVSGGSITRNGAFNYIQVDSFSAGLSGGLPQDDDPGVPGQPLRVNAWRERFT